MNDSLLPPKPLLRGIIPKSFAEDTFDRRIPDIFTQVIIYILSIIIIIRLFLKKIYIYIYIILIFIKFNLFQVVKNFEDALNKVDPSENEKLKEGKEIKSKLEKLVDDIINDREFNELNKGKKLILIN